MSEPTSEGNPFNSDQGSVTSGDSPDPTTPLPEDDTGIFAGGEMGTPASRTPGSTSPDEGPDAPAADPVENPAAPPAEPPTS